MTAEPSRAATDTGVVDAENPWPGLLSFREADQAWFQGRRRETNELLSLVRRDIVTLLFGISGVGKSSLLQAGLFPQLRADNVLPIRVRLAFTADHLDLPGQILEAIDREAEAAGVEAPAPTPGETLWEYFHRRDNDFWSARNRPLTPVLVLDQFEEIFTLGRRSPGRIEGANRLVAELADLAAGRPSAAVKARLDANPDETRDFVFTRHPYKILLGMREDFLAELDSILSRFPSVALNRMRLRRMDGNAALLVAAQARQIMGPDVATQVVRFVAAAPPERSLAEMEVEPALLSVICRELNNRRRERGASKITADLLEGDQQEILHAFYERSVAGAPDEMRRFIEERLITPRGDRDSVALDSALELPGITREALDPLIGNRLLRIEEQRGVQRLELTHDRLTSVVRASARQRQAQLATERERQARIAAEESRRKAMRRTRVWVAAAGLLLAVAVAFYFTARKAWREQAAAAELEKVARAAEASQYDAAAKAQRYAILAEEKAKIADASRHEADKSAAAAQARSIQLRRKTEELERTLEDLRNRNATIELLRGSMAALAHSGGREETLAILTKLIDSQDETVKRVAAAVRLEIAPPSGVGNRIRAAQLLPATTLSPLANADVLRRQVADIWNRYGGAVLAMSAELQVDPSVVMAFLIVETAATLPPTGRMPILLEVRQFLRRVPEPKRPQADEVFRIDGARVLYRPSGAAEFRPLISQNDQYAALALARQIDENAAFLTTTMGIAEVFGAQYQQIGYPTPKAMFDAFQYDERNQFAGLIAFLIGKSTDTSRMVVALQSRAYPDFVRYYNGAAGIQRYSARLAETATIAAEMLKPLGLK
jgi:hypothetical protein